TQTHNYSPEKIKFLEVSGLQRIILARELSLERIREISKNTNADLEFFVHGALCVSFSGQCYFSQATTGRSANRGECSQSCRVPYDLEDKDGKVIAKNKHLLSLKDLDLSAYLRELLESGVTSFKIEGRLKDVNYVKNITAYYRQKLDAILAGNLQYGRQSSGSTNFTFTPDPERTFSRGYTDYFIKGEDAVDTMASWDTPKSLGKPVAEVIDNNAQYCSLSFYDKLVNGDGICFFDDHNDLRGMFINKLDGNKLFTEYAAHIPAGAILYRNNDLAFEQMLSHDKSARKIQAVISMKQTAEMYVLTVTDEDGIEAEMHFGESVEVAKNQEKAMAQFELQLKKSGDSVFAVTGVSLDVTTMCFLPISQINDLRRTLLNRLCEARIKQYKRPERIRNEVAEVYPAKTLDYRGNVTNALSKEFYEKHGVIHPAEGFELIDDFDGKSIMTTKYCIKQELHACPFVNPGALDDFQEPFYIKDKNRKYKLSFDCNRCEMRILYEG
ncbi:MAG: U32 family peptidase, partial [Ignavibacteriales bacterium]|nr:U32 family peptidase [Ignavibacteriales bacterium]